MKRKGMKGPGQSPVDYDFIRRGDMDFQLKLSKMRKSGFIIWVTFLILFCLAEIPRAIADDPGMRLSLRGLEFEIGGELELEFVDSEADGRTLLDKNTDPIKQDPNPFPRMSIDKFVITSRIHLETGILLKADL